MSSTCPHPVKQEAQWASTDTDLKAVIHTQRQVQTHTRSSNCTPEVFKHIPTPYLSVVVLTQGVMLKPDKCFCLCLPLHASSSSLSLCYSALSLSGECVREQELLPLSLPSFFQFYTTLPMMLFFKAHKHSLSVCTATPKWPNQFCYLWCVSWHCLIAG